MKKIQFLSLCALLLLNSCASEFNRIYKSTDYDFKYEYAKQCFAEGRYAQAATFLQELVSIQKGGENAEESLYMLGMAEYLSRDYESAALTLKKYGQSYPKGMYAEQAAFYVGQSLYESSPEPRLDQTPTTGAMNAYQKFLDEFPESPLRVEAQKRLFELQDKLVVKELLSARLYYNLGGYFGNVNANNESNYESCIITAENALKNYPYSKLREQFAVLIMRSKFELAENSSAKKRLERYRDAEDECYGFLNEYPDSEQKSTAEKFIAKCKKITKD